MPYEEQHNCHEAQAEYQAGEKERQREREERERRDTQAVEERRYEELLQAQTLLRVTLHMLNALWVHEHLSKHR